jgi:hypothetical protein
VLRGVGLLAVQIESDHPIGPSRSGIVGITVFTLGVLLFSYGMVTTLRTRRWRAAAFPTRGRVVDNVPQPHGRKTMWFPVIEFEAEGATRRSTIPSAEARQGWPLGYPVELLYDPANPRHTGLADEQSAISWCLILGIAVLGVFFAVVAT